MSPSSSEPLNLFFNRKAKNILDSIILLVCYTLHKMPDNTQTIKHSNILCYTNTYMMYKKTPSKTSEQLAFYSVYTVFQLSLVTLFFKRYGNAKVQDTLCLFTTLTIQQVSENNLPKCLLKGSKYLHRL